MKGKKYLNIIFLTISRINSIEDSGIYTDLLRKFRDEGHSITIVSPIERRFKGKTELVEKEGVQLLKVRTLNIQKTHFIEKGIGTLILEYQFIGAIKKYLSDKKFDLVLYATPPITLVKPISFLKKRDSAFTYLMLKDIFPQNAIDLGMFSEQSPLYKLFRRKEKELYAISDYIGCMSPANINYVLQHNDTIVESKVGLCPNAIDTSRILLKKIKKKDENKPLRFIYGGNLGKPQGIEFLLQIIESYKNKSDVEFYIVGAGTEYLKIKKRFEELKLTNAFLKNQLPKDEYEELVATADVGMIFLDSRFTIPNFPSRLLSYLQSKIPVFCAVDKNTDIGIIAENNNFGVSCLHGDLKEAKNKLESLIKRKNELESMGNNGFEFLLKHYSVETAYNSILEAYVQKLL